MSPSGDAVQPLTTGRDFPDLRVEGGELGAARWYVSTTVGGASVGDFAEANMADHVGDDVRAVESNRRAFGAALGVGDALAFIRAEHGGRYAWVNGPGDVANVDGLITDRPGLGLVGMGADCACIAFYGTYPDDSSVVAVAHCGWRGLAGDIIGNVVAGLTDAGVHRLQAVVGPAICGSCYRVSWERCETVLRECSPAVAKAAIVDPDPSQTATADNAYGVDIAAGVVARLEECGVECVEAMGCTYEDERWFSLRRAVADADARGPLQRTGRHALGIVLP